MTEKKTFAEWMRGYSIRDIQRSTPRLDLEYLEQQRLSNPYADLYVYPPDLKTNND